MPKDLPFTEIQLRAAYVDHGLSLSGVAKAFGTSIKIVRRGMRQLAIDTRRVIPNPVDPERSAEASGEDWYGSRLPSPFSKRLLWTYYIVERLSCRQIAARLGVARKTLTRALAEADIGERPLSLTARAPKATPIARNKSRSNVYSVWYGMQQRCYNPNSKNYHRYGGRGITICDRWRTSLKTFAADMGPRPRGFSIERKDNNGGYSPDNCIWADRTTQQNNRSTNFYVKFHGEKLTLTQLSRRTGLGLYGLRGRLLKGMPAELAVSAPMLKQRKARHLTAEECRSALARFEAGESQGAIARDLGCHDSHVCRTIKRLRAAQ